MKFTEFGFSATLMEGLDAMGFSEATPIQEQAIPAIMAGRDLLGCAQTGTGKTAAFLLPILNRYTTEPHSGTDTLIIGPTRELVQQVDRELEGFSYFTPVSSIPIYGGRDGQSMDQERKALKTGAPVIVATPGRLIAHLDLGYVDFSRVRHFILDEADRMLDMGFVHDIMKIAEHLPKDRQTLFFSATMPPKIRKFARELLNNPVEVNVAVSKPAENILQAAYEVEDGSKVMLVANLLDGKKNLQRTIIFASTKKKVREVSIALIKKGVNAVAISSDLEQNEREEALQDFRSGKIPVVVATDVLSRGIDIKGIDVVINFDVPPDPEDYVHRIGRTARADASGVALTFISKGDRGKFSRIEEMINMTVRRLPLPEGIPMGTPSPPKGGRGGGSGGGGGRSGGRSGGGGGGGSRGRSSDRRSGGGGGGGRREGGDRKRD
ncbi:MAG: ATP-dependent RNA helicase [Bacteroidetes bacterium]|nr:MAG: ATP-dependent RNA helicase [Bacteroidota bacterium]PTM08953.1 MAG: ATP-dependent RNA helicase [Bacteroidota bacterium]